MREETLGEGREEELLLGCNIRDKDNKQKNKKNPQKNGVCRRLWRSVWWARGLEKPYFQVGRVPYSFLC